MAKSKPAAILLSGEPNRQQREAGGVITPGDFLALGSGDTVTRAVAGAVSLRWIALENDIVGDGITDDYASGEAVQIHSCRPGDRVLGTLELGQNIAVGDRLELAANGKLVSYTQDSAASEQERFVIAVALEAINASSSSAFTEAGTSLRIKVEIV